MIKKRTDGFYVVSESGKNLGGPYPTKDKAAERLRQVEHFKNKTASTVIGNPGDGNGGKGKMS